MTEENIARTLDSIFVEFEGLIEEQKWSEVSDYLAKINVKTEPPVNLVAYDLICYQTLLFSGEEISGNKQFTKQTRERAAADNRNYNRLFNEYPSIIQRFLMKKFH